MWDTGVFLFRDPCFVMKTSLQQEKLSTHHKILKFDLRYWVASFTAHFWRPRIDFRSIFPFGAGLIPRIAAGCQLYWNSVQINSNKSSRGYHDSRFMVLRRVVVGRRYTRCANDDASGIAWQKIRGPDIHSLLWHERIHLVLCSQYRCDMRFITL